MTYTELLQAMLDKVPSNVDKREGSIIYDALAPCAYFLSQQNFQLDNFVDLVFPDTAIAGYLDRAVASFGITRNPATPAVRKMVTSSAVEIGSRWGIENLVYAVMAPISENNYAVECETAGEIGNWYTGSMQPLSNVLGITAELTDVAAAGTDEETDAALRARYLTKVRFPATSGNAYHYQQWAMSVPGVGAAKVFPLNDGAGTVMVLVVDSDKDISLSLPDTVLKYIETVRPIGVMVSVSSPVATAINVTADILLAGSQAKSSVVSAFKQALNDLLKKMIFCDYRVSHAKVGSLLLSIDGVEDYDNLTLNASAANVIIAEKNIPIMGTVDLSEVTAIGTD